MLLSLKFSDAFFIKVEEDGEKWVGKSLEWDDLSYFISMRYLLIRLYRIGQSSRKITDEQKHVWTKYRANVTGKLLSCVEVLLRLMQANIWKTEYGKGAEKWESREGKKNTQGKKVDVKK
jgi:hypothetical protein